MQIRVGLRWSPPAGMLTADRRGDMAPSGVCECPVTVISANPESYRPASGKPSGADIASANGISAKGRGRCADPTPAACNAA